MLSTSAWPTDNQCVLISPSSPSPDFLLINVQFCFLHILIWPLYVWVCIVRYLFILDILQFPLDLRSVKTRILSFTPCALNRSCIQVLFKRYLSMIPLRKIVQIMRIVQNVVSQLLRDARIIGCPPPLYCHKDSGGRGRSSALYPFPQKIFQQFCSVGSSGFPYSSPSVCQGPAVPLGITNLDRVIPEA